ncbi:hypothetical protein Salat_2522900 [Sesamum alatum]|uniref:Uncharacterized protein n=1 Tax=Sesamum alatum TaxID=300844 RepID=A0AAE2CCC9_9LAMI|nr:hypothetical protein Salat_2522900 [Sesamum alatum]
MVLLGSGENQENNSKNTLPSKLNTDFQASERVSRSSAQSPYVKINDVEKLLEEAVRRGAEAALMTNGRRRWGPRNQVQRSPRQEEKTGRDSVGSSRAPSPKRDVDRECLVDHPDVDELRREVAELKATIKPPTHFTRGNPFSEEILNEPVPPGIRIPQVTCYGGEKGDPRDHLDQFLAAMDLVSPSDALLCKVFRTTLVGEKENPVRNFMQSITGKIMDIPHVSPELLSSIIAQGLKDGGLADSLIGEPASSWEELLIRAKKFVLIEESLKLRGYHQHGRERRRDEGPRRRLEDKRKAQVYIAQRTTQEQTLKGIEKSKHL